MTESFGCTCVGACDCADEHDLYVVSEWEQHDRDTNRRGNTAAAHPSRTSSPGTPLRLVIEETRRPAGVIPAPVGRSRPDDFGDAA